MKRVVFISLLLFLYGFMFSETQRVLAILDIEPKENINPDVAEFISERIRIEIFKSGKYRLVERKKINKILEEQKMELLNDNDNYIKKMGNLLSADEIMFGTLSFISGVYYLNVKIVDVKTSEMLFGKTIKAKDITELSSYVELLPESIGGKNNDIIDKEMMDIVEINKFVKSVVKYALKTIEEKTENVFPTNVITNEEPKKVELKKENNKKEDIFKVGGGLSYKYFPCSELKVNDRVFSGLSVFGFKGIFGFFDTFGIGFAFNIGGVYNEFFEYNYTYGLTYGGLTLDLYRKFFGFLRLDLNCLIGWGIENSYFINKTNYQNISSEVRNSYMVVEPGIMASINVFNIFELGITANYLFSNPESLLFKNNSYNFGVLLIFGL